MPGAVHGVAPRLHRFDLLGVEHLLPADVGDDTRRPAVGAEGPPDDQLLPVGAADVALPGDARLRAVSHLALHQQTFRHQHGWASNLFKTS